MADDELKKRGENRIYGIAQTLKMADDGYKKCEASNIHETAHALKMDENEFKKRGENSFMEPPTLEDGRRVQSLGIAIQEDNAGGEHYPNFKKHL
jgi:hypothetical protein